MIDPNTVAQIRQKRFDNLAARRLHTRRQEQLNNLSSLVDYLALAVPVLYFILRYLAKGTSHQWLVDAIWELLAGLLFAAALLKIVRRWPDRAQRHSTLMGENIALVRQASDILADTSKASQESARQFLTHAAKSDKEDTDALGEPKPEDRQFAFREAMKEDSPSNIDVTCPRCHASPYNFTAGPCQLCGNTPATANV